MKVPLAGSTIRSGGSGCSIIAGGGDGAVEVAVVSSIDGSTDGSTDDTTDDPTSDPTDGSKEASTDGPTDGSGGIDAIICDELLYCRIKVRKIGSPSFVKLKQRR